MYEVVEEDEGARLSVEHKANLMLEAPSTARRLAEMFRNKDKVQYVGRRRVFPNRIYVKKVLEKQYYAKSFHFKHKYQKAMYHEARDLRVKGKLPPAKKKDTVILDPYDPRAYPESTDKPTLRETLKAK